VEYNKGKKLLNYTKLIFHRLPFSLIALFTFTTYFLQRNSHINEADYFELQVYIPRD